MPAFATDAAFAIAAALRAAADATLTFSLIDFLPLMLPLFYHDACC